jgi:uncharacterized membrane protein YidH (DUF202 family)
MAGFALASLNCGYFLRYAHETRSVSRRVGAVVLVAVSLALALEALLFLSTAPEMRGWQSQTRAAATLVVRSALLLSPASISVLVWRQGWPPRR